MVVNDGEILEAAGMLSNPTTHISLGIWKPGTAVRISTG